MTANRPFSEKNIYLINLIIEGIVLEYCNIFQNNSGIY